MSTSAALPERPKPSLVAVIGTTGVGKSQLGVELAHALSKRTRSPRVGEVVNHDSMQCYRGLDVITNKATLEEMDGVPHHLMGFLEPGDEWGVNEFQRDALAKIDELAEKEALPIFVGGTTYYLQHLVFPNQLVADATTSRPTPPCNTSSPGRPKTRADVERFPASLREAIDALPTELNELFFALPALPATSTPDDFPIPFPLDALPPRLRSPDTLTPALYKLLQLLDPASAARWHWRDVRKVRRALDIVWEGRTWQDVVEEQQRQPNEGTRFRSLIFWLYAENEALHPRLDGRVDKMIDRGLLDEIDELWDIAHRGGAASSTTDYSKGIYQAIGYKEFDPFLAARHRQPSATIESASALRKLFDDGVESMKVSTRQYAKRQVKWIKSKLLPAVRNLADPQDAVVVLLDASDLSKWNENVLEPATRFLEAFLDDRCLPNPLELSPAAALHLAQPSEEDAAQAKLKRACDTCTRDSTQPFLVEERQWNAHIKTRAHRIQHAKKSGQRVVDRTPPPPADTRA
ncbi:hypothetical protein JCM10212_005889 [Sporobolomyces blumeae]